MIYLDVTSACQSALNTGVKRIQRGLHGWLRERGDYRPVCWQSARRAYRLPSPKDLATLEESATSRPGGLGLVDSFAPGFFSDRLHFFRDARSLLAWPAGLGREDVILVPDLVWDNRGTFLARLGATPARRIGVFHDAIALRHPRQSRLDRHFCARGIRALAAFDLVLCISREAESDLRHYWRKWRITPAPTQVAPWPVPFTGPRPPVEPNFAARLLLCVARLEPHKNHLRLLEACELLWREGLAFELRLIGCMAYPDTAWKIWRRLRSLQRAGRAIRWQAHVGEAELHAAYRAASFTLFPSQMEGLGLPILESLWHGRPVVCGTRGALGETAAGGGCEPIDPQDTSSVAAAIRRLLTDEPHYRTLFTASQKRPFRTWADYGTEIAPLLPPSS